MWGRQHSQPGGRQHTTQPGRTMTASASSSSVLLLLLLLLLWAIIRPTRGVPGERCLRTCQEGQAPRLCEFNFTLEWYRVLSKACFNCPTNVSDCYRPDCVAADGHIRPIITVNRQLPGPPIHVCEGDRVLVWVRNLLEDGSATSLHWHGLHQLGSPYMDGVGDVTQCNIQTGELFRYEFVAEPAGTHLYHAHTGMQMADGVFGAVVVRRPLAREPSGALYQHDLPRHQLLLNDWLPVSSVARYVDYMHDKYDVFLPYNALINGRGRNPPSPAAGGRQTQVQTPLSVVSVERGQSYRLRVVGANQNCPFQVSVDGHQLTLIAADGFPVQPRLLDAFLLLTGERYDFVLNATQEVGNYWIRAVALGDCSFVMKSELAILRYQGAPETEPAGNATSGREGILLNPIVHDREDPLLFTNHTLIHHSDLRYDSSPSDPQNYTLETVDFRYYLSMDYYNNDNSKYNRKELYPAPPWPQPKAHLTPVLDGITFQLPSTPPLSQPQDAASIPWCNVSSLPDPASCRSDLCVCTHLLHFPLHKVVEMVLVNEGATLSGNGHPMHLHGHSFRVLGLAKLNTSVSRDDVRELDRQGALPRNLVNPPWKDTVNVVDGGYVILRFRTDNPGYWFFHCHTDSHLAQGMALLIRAGEDADLPALPQGMPRCGGYGSAYAHHANPETPPRAPQPCLTSHAPSRPLEWSPFLLTVVVSLALLALP